jgi:hypothetical protein
VVRTGTLATLPLIVRNESQDRRRPGRCSACGSGRVAVVGQRAARVAQKQQQRRDWWILIKATLLICLRAAAADGRRQV